MQTKIHHSVLNCWWLLPGRFDAGLFQRRSGGNYCGLKVLSRSRGQVLPGREPLIEFGVAGDAAVENPGLQFGEFELLVGDGVVGVERDSGERDLSVLPSEIAHGEQTVAGELAAELVERPVAVSLEFEHASAQIAAACDGSGFGEVDLGLVGTLNTRTAEVRDLS